MFFTQITMEAAEDPEFLDAMKRAHIKGALVGVESVTRRRPEVRLQGLQRERRLAGRAAAAFQEHGVHVLGSFIFGLPSDRADTFDATLEVAEEAGITFAQFVMLTPFPGTLDFGSGRNRSATIPSGSAASRSRRHWLIPQAQRPKIYIAASGRCRPTRSARSTQEVWDQFLQLPQHLGRARVVNRSSRALAFVLISKIYRQMYANTGIATDSARVSRSAQWARWMARPAGACLRASPCPSFS